MFFLVQPQLWFSSAIRNSSYHSSGNEWQLDEAKADVSRKKPGNQEPRGDLPWYFPSHASVLYK